MKSCLTALSGTLILMLACVAPSVADAGAGPAQWAITSIPGPSHFKLGSGGVGCASIRDDCDVFIVTATNVGGEPASGPVTIEDTLPAGVVATETPIASPTDPRAGGGGGELFTRTALTCPTTAPPTSFTCTYPDGPGHQVAPGDSLTFTVPVAVTSAPPGGTLANTATVSGGGAQSASTDEPTSWAATVGEAPVPFSLATLLSPVSTLQAGGYPDFTTSFTFNLEQAHRSAGSPRDVEVELPPGLLGNPRAVPRCNIGAVRRKLCPLSSAVGVATVAIGGAGESLGSEHQVVLVYNVTPYPNEPAAFAFQIAGTAGVRLDTSVVPNASDEYAIHVSVPYVNQSEPIVSSSVTLWGVPGEYDGPGPDRAEENVTFGTAGSESALAKPFMRYPTTCATLPPALVDADSWEQPGAFTAALEAPLSPSHECGLLAPLFAPSLSVLPRETRQAGDPSGYDVALEVPQSESAQRLATPDLKDAVVTLPAGVVASPSAANGLQSCDDAEFGSGENGVALTAGPASCPPQSQIGTVKVKTPLLEEALTGQVFLGQPECSPCGPAQAEGGALLRLFLQIQYGSGEYVRIKLAGRTEIDQRTGQLSTVFLNSPQFPFETLSLDLKGGQDAPLANPSACGTATSTAWLTPWSGGAPAEPSSGFQVEGCSPLGFSPSFSAGMTEGAQAGGYSSFAVSFARADGQQDLGAITVTTPPGLLGAVAHAALCAEAQANAGTCGPESEIGEASTAVGPGSEPYWVTGGRVYLTGPYGGDPFGLSVVVPAVAGPFRLAGNTGSGSEVVRAGIAIDPNTAALTIASGQLPSALDGIPLQIKAVDVRVNRPQFMFNGTNCGGGLSVGATLSSPMGARAGASSSYQPVNCAALPFKPSFTASTQAKASKAGGASLVVKVAAKPGEANIHKVDIRLPLQLPSRLTTLQKACTEAQFNANPAGCPAASAIGTAIARTPVLQAPLVGPAYLVSRGGAAFPDVEFVLQADERGGVVEIVLDGLTDIKDHYTYSKFETLPDAPISSFETTLPEGPHSALTTNIPANANYDLCGQSLQMPTTIVAQSGATLTQSTSVSVVGCPKPTVAIVRIRGKRGELFVEVKASIPGTIAITGRGLRGATGKLSAGAHTLEIMLTKVGRSLLKRHARDGLKVTFKSGAGMFSKTKKLRL